MIDIYSPFINPGKAMAAPDFGVSYKFNVDNCNLLGYAA
jgi:hypothetical protein